MSAIRIGGCDPGFANVGLGMLDLFPIGASSLLATQLITTKPGTGKVKQIDDELRRLHEIEDVIVQFIEKWRPDVLAMEEPGKCLMRRPIGGKMVWQTNPTLLRTACLMWGSISGICRARNVYVVKYGSQQIKKAVCGSNSASKTDMERELKSRYGSFSDWTRTKKIEHEVDAVGAAVTAFKEPFVMTLLRNLENRE